MSKSPKTRRSCMVQLTCGVWMRTLEELVDLEVWDQQHPEVSSGVGFGMGSKPGEFCDKHHKYERVTQVSFFEWHVFCRGDAESRCGYNSWHGVDAEKARADYARHEKLWPSHRLVVGWDGFTGELLEQGSQGQLFVPDEVDRVRKAVAAARETAMKSGVKPPRRTPTRDRRHIPESNSLDTLRNWNP